MATVLKKTPTAQNTRVDSGDGSDDGKTAARQVVGLAGFNLNDLAEQGRAQLEACRAEIRRMLDDAEKQAVQVQQDAENRGYEAGLLKAEKDIDQRVASEAAKRAKQQLAMLNQTATNLKQAYQNWMADYHEVLMTTALAAAHRVVRNRLENDQTILVDWVADALHSTRAATKLTVAVHPEVLAELGGRLDELVASSDLPESTTVVPDESLARTDVVIRQNGGEIQAGLSAQLDRLAEVLR